MRIVRLDEIEGPGPSGVLARPFLEGDHANVRVIRLGPAQALPPHRHGSSDLMLFVAAGSGELDTPEGVRPFGAGSLAWYRGDEELRVRNVGQAELTMLAFLSPKFATT